MMTTTTGARRAELATRGMASTLRLVDQLRSLDDAAAGTTVPALDWTVAETAAHIVNLYGRGLGDWRRSDSPATTAALNATCLAEYAERDLAVIADRVAADADAVWHQVLPQLPDDLEVPFHAGATTTVVPIMGVLLTEMLVHGRDIADAAGRPWDIGDDDAWCALTAVAPLLSAWRRPDAAADTIAIPGPAGAALRLTFTPSSVESTVGPIDDADRIVDATPSQAVLAILGRPTDDTLLVTLGQRFGPF